MAELSLINEQSNETADTDRSIVKMLAVIFSAVVFAALFGYFLSQLNFIYSLISATLFLAVFSLQAFFIKDWNVTLFAIFIEVSVIVAPFYKSFSLLLLGLFFLFFLFLFFAVLSGRRELQNALHIPFFKVIKSVLISSIVAVILLVSSIFIFGGLGSDLMTEKNFQAVLDPVIAPVMWSVFPNSSVGMPLESVISGFIKKQLQDTNEFRVLSESAKNDYLGKVVKEEAKAIEKSLSVPLDFSKSMSQNIYMITVSLINKLEPQNRDYVGLIILITIWLTIGSIASIFYIPVAIITYIIFEILLAMEFAVIQYESRSREIIILK